MTTTEAILDSIDQRLRAARAEIDTLTAARSALDGREEGSTPRRARTTAKPATSRRRSSRPKTSRTAEVVPAGRLESLLSQNGGLTTTALAERTNGDRDQILTLLRELEAAGRIRRTGQRRGTRWHAITDDDRIRQRAAELEGRRRRKS